MILIPIMDEIDKLIGELPAIIDGLEKNSIGIEKESVEYIRKLEDKARKYNLPISAELSIIRGKLLCGEAHNLTDENVSRKERKSEQKRFVLDKLEQAHNCICEYFKDNRKIFDECERLVCQVITRLNAKGTLNNVPDEITGKMLIKAASRDSELAPITVHIIGLIGAVNAQIIFDKTISVAGIYN